MSGVYTSKTWKSKDLYQRAKGFLPAGVSYSIRHFEPYPFYTDRAKAAYWDGRNEIGEQVASGIYFYTIQAEGFTATRKMTVRK